MSQATKRKHVVKEVLGEHMVPSDQQQIVRVSGIRDQLLCFPRLLHPLRPLGLGQGAVQLGRCWNWLMKLIGSCSPLDQVLRTPGNNLHEVETAQGQRFLVSMPSKYRKNIWIKRGERGSLLGDRSVSCGLGFPHYKQDRLCFSLLPLQGTFSSLTLLKKERR